MFSELTTKSLLRETLNRQHSGSDALSRRRSRLAGVNAKLSGNSLVKRSILYRRDDALAGGVQAPQCASSDDYDLVCRLSLRETVSIKPVAFREYGYRETIAAGALWVAKELLTRLPGGVSYRLFNKTVIRGECAR